jgi:hypothetical protein
MLRWAEERYVNSGHDRYSALSGTTPSFLLAWRLIVAWAAQR